MNPQIMALTAQYTVPNSASATGVVASIPNPAWDLNRAAGAGSCPQKKAFVMEILKIWLLLDSPAIGANATIPIYGFSGTSVVAVNAPPAALATASTIALSIEWLSQQAQGTSAVQPSASCLAVASTQTHFTAGTNTTTVQDISPGTEMWKMFDLTDGAGHGVIIGTQQIQILAAAYYNQTPGITQNQQYGARILYRFKGVPYDEFIRQYTFGY